MRKISILVAMVLFATASHGQNGILSVFAGNGSFGYSGDGGPATAASIGMYGINIDNAGNIYFADNSNGVVRKVNTSGIITTVAGTGFTGYTGDGGPATAAQTYAGDVVADGAGNLYIADDLNHVIRKVNTAGIISTIAGTGVAGYSGDGGPATAAELSQSDGAAVDAAGNVYFTDRANHVVRKINTAGIITTVVGTGVAGYGGDGGPATAAQLNTPKGIALDGAGNMYIGDGINNRVRKVTAAGIITTIAGNGAGGYGGDGGPATAAQIDNPSNVQVGPAGDVFVCEYNGFRVRKVTASGIITTVAGNGSFSCVGSSGPATSLGIAPVGVAFDAGLNMYVANNFCNNIGIVTDNPAIVSDSFSLYLDKQCNGLNVTALSRSSSPSLSIKIYFGDNFNTTSALTSTTPGYQATSVTHSYDFPGTYTMKVVLYSSGSPIDSIIYSYNCLLCNTFQVGFFYDANSNCTRDGSETSIYLPMLTEVDSNGVPVDTISATSGFFYTAYGNTNDIYTFRLISMPPGIHASCSTGGIVTDTMKPGMYNTSSKDLPLSCTSTPGFDLAEYVTARAGRHTFWGDIIVNNTYCTPQPAVVTANLSSKYSFSSASPAPTSVSGNTITWNFSDISITSPQPHIHFSGEVPGAWLLPGDTVHSDYATNPVSGDMIVGNNTCVKVDTVTSSFDPNEMLVSPEGYIASGTQLQYTIHFENTGNDTAENIYVMDTVSAYVIPSSMRVIASSATMNVLPLKSGAYNILKFDFPHIKLLDSTHHNECHGTVIFTINTRNGLPYGTVIPNKAGIYFDDNEVVMTNTVENIIPYPSVCCLPPVKGNVSIYPNPANDELMIRMDYGGYSSFTISNSIGQTLAQRDLTANITKVDLRTFAPGMYYITLRGESGTQVQKFVKK